MNKVVRDGRVAVLYSPGYGAGWSSWARGYNEEMVFDPWIVDILESEEYSHEDKVERILSHCAVKYPDLYTGGVADLSIEWVPVGTAFKVNDYDGNESIEYRDMTDWIIA